MGVRKVLIRNYTESDAESVNTTALSAFTQYRDDYKDWSMFSRRIASMSALQSDGEIIVAEVGGGYIAGAIGYVPPLGPRRPIFPAEWALLRMLVVSPEARGNGIGRALVEECLQRAKRDGAEVVGLHTSPIMVVARKLYSELGFVEDCEMDPIHGVPYSRYYLTLQ